jgi:oxalate decarboxylase/phosphoglucose isomerase-like protein (cupin superfamily)
MLILLKSPVYEEVNISTWLAAKPASFITDNFGVGKELVDKLLWWTQQIRLLSDR